MKEHRLQPALKPSKDNIGIVIVPLGWLAFALEYTNHARLVTRRNIFTASIFPALMLILVWSNELHGWVWRDTTLKVNPAAVRLLSLKGSLSSCCCSYS